MMKDVVDIRCSFIDPFVIFILVDQGCQDDPDFQSILSNRMQA